MGERQNNLFEPQLNGSVKVQAIDHQLTSNAGVFLLREAEHRLGLCDSITHNVADLRRPDHIGTRVFEDLLSPWRGLASPTLAERDSACKGGL